MRARVTLLFGLLASSVLAQPIVETKQTLVAGLIQFMEALPGTYGDEGPALRSSLDAIEQGLARWDASLRAYEIAMASESQTARAGDAAAAHRLLGAVYLERGWTERALTELNAAVARDPRPADVYRLLGLTYDGANKPAEAADAFHHAWTIEPNDPVNAYLFLSHARTASHRERVRDALGTLAAFQQKREANQDDGPAAPFLTLTLVEERPATDPMFPPVRYAAGFALTGQGRYEEMATQFRDAASSDPLIADAAPTSSSMAEGIRALRDGRMAIAFDHLTQAARSAPDSSEAHRVLATAYAFDEQYEKSIPEFEAAIRLNPQDERSRLALADTLLRPETIERCEQVLLDTVRVMPSSGEAHWRLGQVYLRLTRQHDALTHFERAAALGPLAGSSRVYETLGRLYLSATRGEEAIEAFRKHVRANLNDGEAHRELGDAYRAQDRLDDALAELLAAILLNPRDADAHASIGRIHFSAGRYGEAVASARRAVLLDETHQDARYTLATGLIRLGEATEGKQQLDLFQRLQADSLEAQRLTYELNGLKLDATRQLSEGRYPEAARSWRTIVEREGTSANRLKLAQALARAGIHEEAIEQLQALAAAGQNPDAYRALAASYAAVGRTEESEQARATYQRFKEERLRARGAGR